MRVLLCSAIFLLFFAGCKQEPKPKDNGTGLTTDAPSAKVSFRCESLGEDENGTPHHQVFLVVNEKSVKIADVNACDEIPKEEYHGREIPANAIAACGGWWAGGGDYFYALEYKGMIVVMKGWQDEGQEDTGYHYEQFTTVTIE